MSQLPLRVFGLGVDIAHIPRFARTLERHGERFLKKAYHPTEIEEFYAREPSQRAVFLASRWAVKEATFKAFQRYRVLFPEIYTLRQSQSNDCAGSDARHVQTKLPIAADSKALGLAFCGETQALAEQLQIVDAHVSLSHDKDYAIAYVLVHQLQSQAS